MPLGLADEEDSISRSVLASRLQNETKRVFLSSTEGQKNQNDTEQELKEISFGLFERRGVTVRPLFTNNNNSKAFGVVPDLADFSSTNDLIPLTFAALNDEKSRRFVWLDNISLMVSLSWPNFHTVITSCIDVPSFSGHDFHAFKYLEITDIHLL